MESRPSEVCESQQLVSSEGENEDTNAVPTDEKSFPHLRSNKISSTGTSHSSVSKQNLHHSVPSTSAPAGSSKLFYINEKRFNKDSNKAANSASARPRTIPKALAKNPPPRHHCFISEVPDVRHMEQVLLSLLADFHSGKLKAFGSGITMEQMTNIREQQEKLAKLHFDLSATNDFSTGDVGFKNSRNTMCQLIDRLEQLSVSIEGLKLDNNKRE